MDALNSVAWEERLRQSSEVEPLVRRVLDDAMVEVQAVYVEVGQQAGVLWTRIRQRPPLSGGLQPSGEPLGAVAQV